MKAIYKTIKHLAIEKKFNVDVGALLKKKEAAQG
jgi:hypothetical protein